MFNLAILCIKHLLTTENYNIINLLYQHKELLLTNELYLLIEAEIITIHPDYLISYLAWKHYNDLFDQHFILLFIDNVTRFIVKELDHFEE